MMNISNEEIIKTAYAGFNERKIDDVFSVMHDDVKWPKAFDGGYAEGKNEVREYWGKQWTEINPNVKPLTITERPDGKVAVKVAQLVKDLNGNILFDGEVTHTYHIAGNLILRMDIE